MKRFFVGLAKFLALFFTLLTIVLLILSFVRPDWVKSVIEWIGNIIQTLGNWNYLVTFLSACIESLPLIGTAVPGMNVMILVGGFWGKYHLVATIITAALGAMIGNYIGYWIGKYFGKVVLEKYGLWIGIGKTELRIIENQLKKNGFWYIVFGKFHNLSRAVVPFIAGSSGLGEKKFWLYNMIGSILWASSMIIIGVLFIDSFETLLNHIEEIIIGVLIIFFGYIYFFRRDDLRSYITDKQAEIREQETHHHNK